LRLTSVKATAAAARSCHTDRRVSPILPPPPPSPHPPTCPSSTVNQYMSATLLRAPFAWSHPPCNPPLQRQQHTELLQSPLPPLPLSIPLPPP
jgi:hypothetical protein